MVFWTSDARCSNNETMVLDRQSTTIHQSIDAFIYFDLYSLPGREQARLLGGGGQGEECTNEEKVDLATVAKVKKSHMIDENFIYINLF
mmetsp:Transcript_60024/g.147540  ORF Transcript_60024/g.147540 Transcript_60024/m.147540 type:complete len:89 (+) Transcript_60024:1357-1623(+)